MAKISLILPLFFRLFFTRKNRLFDTLKKKRRFGEINRRFIRLKRRVILPKGRFGFSVLRYLIFNYLYQL